MRVRVRRPGGDRWEGITARLAGARKRFARRAPANTSPEAAVGGRGDRADGFGSARTLARRERDHPKGRRGDAQTVFLFGHQRSGTNVTVRALERHPDVTLYNEDHPVAFRHSNLVDFGVVGELTEATETPIALFKPISNTRDIFELGGLYRHAKAILAFRHYLPLMHSFAVAFGERGDKALRNRLKLGILDPTIERLRSEDPSFAANGIDTKDLTLLSWCHTTQLMLDFFHANPARSRISLYEDLVTNPHRALDELFTFLDLTPPPGVAESIEQRSRGQQPIPVNPTLRVHAERLYFQVLRATVTDEDILDRAARTIVSVYTPRDDDVVVVVRKRLNEIRAKADRAKQRG